jgi:autoinducer 2-degrading protein
MYVTLVHANVKAEVLEQFLEATRANHEGSIREPGCLRFDILQSVDDPARFVFYEAYVDEAAASAHKETAHYLEWRDLVVDWMVEPRTGVRYVGRYPEAAELLSES